MVTRISPREWRSALIFAVLLMALTTLPYILCAAAQNDDWTFGGSMLGVQDINTYLATMRLGARGDWLFTVFATPEPHAGALFRLPYILMGKVAALFADPGTPALVDALALVYHGARIVSGVALVLITYRFVAAFLHGGAARLAATVIISAGGGLGWLLNIAGLGDWLGSQPVDFLLPEGYTFIILYSLPHLIFSRILLLGGFLLFFKRRSVLAGLCWAGMGMIVPFYIAMLYVILGVWGLATWAHERRFPWSLFWRAVVAALAPLAALLYNAYQFTTNEIFAAWGAQNTLPSPHPLHYVFGYGVLAVPAIIWAWRKCAPRYMLLAAWVAAAPVMVYLPITVQRRLAEGVLVPLAILAVAGLRRSIAPWLANKLKRARRAAWRLVFGVVLALILPTPALLLVGGAARALNPAPPVYHPAAEIAAMDWLAAHAPRGAVVLGALETGNYLTVRADVRVFLGLRTEAFQSVKKEIILEKFFNDELAPPAVASLYEEYGIDYVFYGPHEGADAAPDPAWAAGLTPMYDKAGYTIYEAPD
ncbi:MAG: hypothetical protein JXB47_02465 [Anaerolineae bacterium]|nr:hypothetical protein [Anaerolineae bacterium]